MKYAGMTSLLPFLPVLYLDSVLRPPGAALDFLARCIRCGRCAEACPYDSIRFLGISAGVLLHTPYVDPLKTPCYLCQERGPDGKDRPISKYLRCGDVCPTGAIKPIVNDKRILAGLTEDLKMGTAVINRRLCLAWQYNFCGECYLSCPLKEKALLACPRGDEIVGGVVWPFVDPVYCIGCGVCVYVCPVRKRVAESAVRRDIKLSFFEERYGALVRKLLIKNGPQAELPAIRVIGRFL
ncbi:MAG: 4Fe-4S dicluster domain-containing protein [Thermodesulfobacteriota bacterium]|nr:4Fe-4S dicluster domain-containing protein [Thermodesulfobacteriota bacterium]